MIPPLFRLVHTHEEDGGDVFFILVQLTLVAHAALIQQLGAVDGVHAQTVVGQLAAAQGVQNQHRGAQHQCNADNHGYDDQERLRPLVHRHSVFAFVLPVLSMLFIH